MTQKPKWDPDIGFIHYLFLKYGSMLYYFCIFLILD